MQCQEEDQRYVQVVGEVAGNVVQTSSHPVRVSFQIGCTVRFVTASPCQAPIHQAPCLEPPGRPRVGSMGSLRDVGGPNRG